MTQAALLSLADEITSEVSWQDELHLCTSAILSQQSCNEERPAESLLWSGNLSNSSGSSEPDLVRKTPEEFQ